MISQTAEQLRDEFARIGFPPSIVHNDREAHLTWDVPYLNWDVPFHRTISTGVIYQAQAILELLSKPKDFYLRYRFFNNFHFPTNILSWNDGCVEHIARGIVQEEAFDRQSMLFDVLLEAGSDNEEALNHLRQEAHAGSWVVDYLAEPFYRQSGEALKDWHDKFFRSEHLYGHAGLAEINIRAARVPLILKHRWGYADKDLNWSRYQLLNLTDFFWMKLVRPRRWSFRQAWRHLTIVNQMVEQIRMLKIS